MDRVMDIDVIASHERGVTQQDGILSKHTFSFGKYHNLQRLNFGTLRVFNEDRVEPKKGFPSHSHENMEIVTIVLHGTLEHKDSFGNHTFLKSYDVQKITAGCGITHSEYNASQDESLHFLQIWIYPDQRDLDPCYEQKNVFLEKNVLKKIVSPLATESTLLIHQDAHFYLGHFDAGQSISHTLQSFKHGCFIFLCSGQIKLEENLLKTGDSAQVTQKDKISIQTLEPTTLVLIDMNINVL